MSEPESKPSPKSSKAAIVAAIATAVSGIAVAFITAWPDIRADPPGHVPIVSKAASSLWEIEGALTDGAGMTNGTREQVLLVPKKYETYSDDSGKFTFDDVETGHYFIIIRNESGIKITSVRVTEKLSEKTNLQTTQVAYSIRERTSEDSGDSQ